MRKFTMTISALALSAGMAHAGGMVVPQEPIVAAPAPMMAATYDWTGGYAGVGLSFGRATYREDGGIFNLGQIPGDVFGDNDNDAEAFGGLFPSGSGWGIGGFAGANWQAGNIVYGVEGHLSAHRMRGSTTFTDDNDVENGDNGDTLTVRTNVRGVASLRGRVGFAADRTLFFVTAGPAIASVRHSATLTEDDEATSFSETRSVNGLVLGVGVEHALAGGWHIRGDLEHYRFRGRDFNTGAVDNAENGPLFAGVRTRANVARVSAVFRF